MKFKKYIEYFAFSLILFGFFKIVGLVHFHLFFKIDLSIVSLLDFIMYYLYAFAGMQMLRRCWHGVVVLQTAVLYTIIVCIILRRFRSLDEPFTYLYILKESLIPWLLYQFVKIREFGENFIAKDEPDKSFGKSKDFKWFVGCLGVAIIIFNLQLLLDMMLVAHKYLGGNFSNKSILGICSSVFFSIAGLFLMKRNRYSVWILKCAVVFQIIFIAFTYLSIPNIHLGVVCLILVRIVILGMIFLLTEVEGFR